jgi:hypothetical protein
MKAVVDEPVVGEKIGNSFAGYALEIATVAVKRSLALYCSRAWDEGEDAISLPRLAKALPLEDLREEMKEEHAKLSADCSAVDQNQISALRVFRTENLAHRVMTSRDRKKNVKSGQSVETTIRELIVFGEVTVSLVERLCEVRGGKSDEYSARIQLAERYCREFWRVIPILDEVEDQSVSYSVWPNGA